VRALSIHTDPPPAQDDVSDTLQRWAARRCELRLEDKLDDVTRVGRDLTTELARLRLEFARIASALERRAS